MVLADIKTMIVGKYTGKASDTLIQNIGHPEAYKIKKLRFNRFTGERHFAYYTQDDEYFFIMEKVFESPCEIHRVGG